MLENYNFHTLYLFNAVLSRPENEEPFSEVKSNSNLEIIQSDLEKLDINPIIDQRRHSLAVEYGVLIESSALYAIDDIEAYVHQYRTPIFKAIDATIYSSWEQISSRTDVELFIEQILHYMLDYRPHHQELPSSNLIPPEVVKKLLVVKSITEETAMNDSVKLLKSPTALSSQTLDHLIGLLDVLGADYNSLFDTIRNREGRVRVFPKVELEMLKPHEFLRFLILQHTGESIIIKNKSMVEKIEASRADISESCIEYSLKELSSVFNRFKMLFMAFKMANKANIPVINKLAKLSKVNHRALAENPLNKLTLRNLEQGDMHWLANAGTSTLLRSLNICKLASIPQHGFRYRIRNGKTWVADKERSMEQINHATYNFDIIRQKVCQRFKESGFDFETKFYMPAQIEYGLPISEKQLIGVIPYMTKVIKQDEDLVVGITWREGYRARDLDLSANSLSEKIGWNTSYRSAAGVTYSGDVTSLNDQGLATEFIKCEPVVREEDESLWIMALNCFSGDSEYFFDIMVGRSSCPIVGNSNGSSSLDRDFMLDPGNLLLTAYKFPSIQRQCTVGLVRRRMGTTEFVITPGGDGNRHIKSSINGIDELSRSALVHELDNSITLRELLHDILGCEIVDDSQDADVDLSPECLTSTFFTTMFS